MQLKYKYYIFYEQKTSKHAISVHSSIKAFDTHFHNILLDVMAQMVGL